MELVVDANVFFAALIRASHTRHLLLNSQLKLYVPEFIFEEIAKHVSLLAEKTGLAQEKLRELLGQLLLAGNIQTVPASEIKPFLKRAEAISPDPNDVAYFALALKLGCSIWSNDGRLKRQGAMKVYSTQELLEQLR